MLCSHDTQKLSAQSDPAQTNPLDQMGTICDAGRLQQLREQRSDQRLGGRSGVADTGGPKSGNRSLPTSLLQLVKSRASWPIASRQSAKPSARDQVATMRNLRSWQQWQRGSPRYFSARLTFAGSCHGLSSRRGRAATPSSSTLGADKQAPMATAVRRF